MQICPKCDYQNPPNVRFCGNCGAALAAAEPFQVDAAASQKGASGPSQPTVNVHVTVQVPPAPRPHPAPAPVPSVVLSAQEGGAGCLTRAIYFLLIGWWFSELWIIVAWAFNLTVIGLPLGLAMLNRLPQVTTLKTPRKQTQVTVAGNTVVVSQGALEQYPFLMRAIYFLLVGWWFSLLWAEAAWALCISVVGLPFAFWMFDRVPAVTTLARM
jgi:uncharacterized membrane protein YccF (DUF307 family)